MGSLAASAVWGCAVALFVAAPVAAAAAPAKRSGEPTPIFATALVADLRAGKPVVARNLRVQGPLILTRLETVKRLFRCRHCIFEGRIAAPDVTFEGTVDLSGSTFERGVVFRGATFRGPALFRPTRVRESGAGRPFVFKGVADFSLAVFDDVAAFGQSTFSRSAAFRDAKFEDVTFSRTTFKDGTFAQASFRGTARFNGATFFGRATFEDADFRRRTTFSLATFHRGASFTGAQFADGAAFLRTTFRTVVGGEPHEPAEEPVGARFQNAASAGSLDFPYARFEVVQAPAGTRVALFEDVVCSGSVAFREAVFEGPIGMTRLQTPDLVLDVDAVDWIDSEEDQRDALEKIEESAKVRGDLRVANDARYELQAQRSEGYSRVGQALDYIFYRGVAGYLVRPSHPLTALVGLAMVMGVLRARRLPRKPEGSAARRRSPRRIWRRVAAGWGDLLTTFLDTLGRAAPRRIR